MRNPEAKQIEPRAAKKNEVQHGLFCIGCAQHELFLACWAQATTKNQSARAADLRTCYRSRQPIGYGYGDCCYAPEFQSQTNNISLAKIRKLQSATLEQKIPSEASSEPCRV
jgi:hypothetical protein